MPTLSQLQSKLTEVLLSLYENDPSIAIITLNRPKSRNAFTPTMGDELQEVFEFISKEDSIRVAIVTGAGQSFCVGLDLKSAAQFYSKGGPRKEIGGALSMSIYNCSKPVIAAVNGDAIGIGSTMTLPMCIRVVSESARYGFVFSKRGIAPEACSSFFLPRIVGVGKAAEWIYTARIFKAKDEENSGLFNYVVPSDQVLPKAIEIAKEISNGTSPMSTLFSKVLLYRGLSESTPGKMHQVENKALVWLFGFHDFKEGVFSFIEKRKPNFELHPSKYKPNWLDKLRPKL